VREILVIIEIHQKQAIFIILVQSPHNDHSILLWRKKFDLEYISRLLGFFLTAKKESEELLQCFPLTDQRGGVA
jgi:hypothetical protein